MNLKYVRAQRTAMRMIKENGAKFYFQDNQGYVTWDSGLVTWDHEPAFAYMVILPPGGDPFSTKTDQYLGDDGFLNLSMFRNILISPEGLTIAPEPHQQVSYQGEWWTIVNLSNLAPDGTVDIFYKGVIRRI